MPRFECTSGVPGAAPAHCSLLTSLGLGSRIADGARKYQELRGGIRPALFRRFPYAVYFAIEGDVAIVVAVLRASRDPAEWQGRKGSPAARSDGGYALRA